VDFALSVSTKRPKGVGPGRLRKPVQKAKDKKKWELALELLERSKVNDSFYGICKTDQVVARFKQNCTFLKIDINPIVAMVYMNNQNFR